MYIYTYVHWYMYIIYICIDAFTWVSPNVIQCSATDTAIPIHHLDLPTIPMIQWMVKKSTRFVFFCGKKLAFTSHYLYGFNMFPPSFWWFRNHPHSPGALLVHQCGHGGTGMHRAARRQTGRKSLTAWATCPGVTPMPFFRRKPPNGGLQKKNWNQPQKIRIWPQN